MLESGPATEPTTRPALHFTARQGWINDPLGLTYHDGQYHLFFQYLPGQNTWSPDCRWGHAVSEDLLAWTEREPILQPGDGDGGCWSGSLVLTGAGPATIFYTSVQFDNLNIGAIRTAQPDDMTWNSWRKGPIVAGVEPTDDAIVFRDPHVSRDSHRWRMLVGSGRSDGTATALAYTSSDLVNWVFSGEFASRSSTEREPSWTGAVWECPQLIPFGDKYALTFAVWEPWIPHYQAYAIGRLVAGRFTIEHWGRLSYGDAYYAGAAFTDVDGQPGLIYWLRGVEDPHQRWTGAHSLPHLLRLDEHDRLIAVPHPNIAKRRGEPVLITPHTPAPAPLPCAADIEWDVTPGPGANLTIRSADRAAVVDLSTDHDQIRIAVAGKVWAMPSSAHLRLIIDGPVLEVFGDAGVFAAPIPIAAARSITIGNGTCSIHAL